MSPDSVSARSDGPRFDNEACGGQPAGARAPAGAAGPHDAAGCLDAAPAAAVAESAGTGAAKR